MRAQCSWLAVAALLATAAVAVVPGSVDAAARSADPAPGAPLQSAANVDKTPSVAKVHLVFTHHLDVGLDLALKSTVDCVGFATKILQRYFDDFIPRALKLSREARLASPPFQFRYQIHSWVGAMFINCTSYTVQDNCPLNPGTLKCPTPAAVAAFETAAQNGDLVWDAGPMNLNPGAVADPGLFSDLVTHISGELDSRFIANASRVRVWSNTDVRGFVRSAIPALVGAGVDVLNINPNGHSSNCKVCAGPQPAVGNQNSTIFRWYDPPSNKSVAVMFHNGYNSDIDRTTAFVIGETALMRHFRSDNSGPPDSLAEVQTAFNLARKAFPGAEVVASSQSAFASEALTEEVVAALPQFEMEWGDVWITGMATDPRRLAEYREIVRARAACIEAGACARDSVALKNMSRYLAKPSEHTQGEQNEEWNPGYRLSGAGLDHTSWSNSDFAKVHNPKHNIFEFGELSWIEARIYNDLAIGAAPPPLRADLATRFAQTKASQAATRPALSGLVKASGLGPFCGSSAITFDARTGALNVTLEGDRYSEMLRYSYVTYADNETWDPRPNVKKLAGAEDKVWYAAPTTIWHTPNGAGESCRIVMESAVAAEAHSKYGAPASQWLDILVNGTGNSGGAVMDATLQLRDKQTTRLGESMMVSNQPMSTTSSSDQHWEMDVLSEWVRPEEVGEGGNQFQHAINSGARFVSTAGHTTRGLLVESLDAGLACPMSVDPKLLGDSSPIGEGAPGYDAKRVWTGMAFNLYNNLMPISGFAQWYPFGTGKFYSKEDESMSFRFRLTSV